MTAEASGTADTPPTAQDAPHRQDGPRAPRPRMPLWAAALTVFPLALLAASFWIGRLVRPGGDDWCFLPVLRDEGVFGMIGKFYLHDNGRIANALMVALYGAGGVAGHQWYATVSGLLILAAVWALIPAALRVAGRTAPRGVPLLVASMTVVVFFFATPNTYKTFYWPASSVSHTVAPALAAAAVIPLLRARSRRGGIFALCVAAVTGLFIGTLSEGTSIVAGVLLCTALLLSLRSRPGPARSRTRLWCGVALAALVAGMIILYTSPGSRVRRDRFGTGATSVVDTGSLADALRTYGDILGVVLTTWTYLGALAVGVLLGLLLRESGPAADGPPRSGPLLPALAGVAAFLVSGYLCTLVTLPAFAHSMLTYGTRTWNDYLFVYVLLLAGLGALLGNALRAHGRGTAAATGTAAALCAGVCVGLAVPLTGLATDMGVRARHWDRQDRLLREEAAKGAEVLPYVPASVGQMRDPFGNHGRSVWPAPCTAQYYHLKRITYATRPAPGPTR
ncbi:MULTISPECIES: DUF6056 family protein [unclassified Streptomyces]|uniref:DUF6056 family protein n=1 Tax=unclassified Streptomyces TaxID=2593676 RepID=UPI000F48A571|nr:MULTISPECIES: DUF6056 family protein [unclassified Streptomyces]MCX4772444.1 DUF6056 family protein [Streptomyces sp. NBC_01285]ROQ71582.1 hypothetical protein EDD95_7703 [Streptomyces sp. CEV 2-1]